MNFRLKELIYNSGLRQNFIAAKMGINPVVFSKKVHGEVLHFTDEEKLTLSKIIKVKKDDI